MDSILAMPFGLVLVTGPSGSGKTTTACCLLHHLAARNLACYSVEDPVEVLLEGVVQVPVGTEGCLDAATALRRILESDPDAIFLADIPNQDVARLACRAAIAGHLVFVQVHASSATDAVAQFLRQTGDPRLVASALAASLNQRLVRRVCKQCGVPATHSESALRALGLPAEPGDTQITKAVGCASCVGGYRGRLPLYEFLLPDDEFLAHVSRGTPEERLRGLARAKGVPSLRQKALPLLVDGSTTLEEILRVTSVE